MLTAAFQNHVVLQFLYKPVSRCRAPTVLSATFKVSRGKRSQTIPHTEYAPLGENPTQEQIGSPSSAWKTQCVFRNLKAQNPSLVGKKFVVKQSSKEKNKVILACIEAMWKSFGKTALFVKDLTPLKCNDEVRDGAQVP